MRMFSSLGEMKNALREPKKTPDISTGFRPPCWYPFEGPKRNWKQCLCKILGGTKSIMAFFTLANIAQP